MATEKTARATWEGDLSGSGRVSTESGAVTEQRMTWSARAEGVEGASPEELIAAAHASCVSMALAHDTDAKATFDKAGDGFRMTTMKLTVRGEVEGIDEARFREVAEQAKENCPVSQALKGNVEISLDAALD